MNYVVWDVNNLLYKIEKYYSDSFDDKGIFLVRSKITENNVIKLMETITLNNYVSISKYNNINICNDIVISKLKEFKKSNNIFTIVHICSEIEDCSLYNIPISDFSIMYNIMGQGDIAKYNLPYILIIISESEIRAELYYNNNIYKDICIIKGINFSDGYSKFDPKYKYIL